MYVLSRGTLFATPRTVACQAPLSMEFSGKNTAVDCHFLLQQYNIYTNIIKKIL